MSEPKILTIDIETAPIEAYVWGIHDQNISLAQVKKDWFILAFGAKWLDESDVMYFDNSKARRIDDDRRLVKEMWKLLDKADIVVTQNGDSFDFKKFNARAVIHGLNPPSYYRSTDVYKESKNVFGFTSQSLDYTSKVLKQKYKKLPHKQFPGWSLWTECLKRNQGAWKEMKEYNIYDVLSTDEKLSRIYSWIKTANMATFYDDAKLRCFCGSQNIFKKGFVYTDSGKFQGYKCKDCGKRPHGRINLLSKEKKASLLKRSK